MGRKTLVSSLPARPASPAPPAQRAVARIVPAGVSRTSVAPSPPGMISPRSRAIVVTAMMPWPDIDEYPAL